eukprot:gene10777-11930_t
MAHHHHEDVLMGGAGFDEVGSTNLFPSLSEPGHSFQFVSATSSTGSAAMIPRDGVKIKAKKKHEKKEKYKEKNAKGLQEFKYKYKRLRRKAKEFVFVNAALADEITYTEQLLVKAKAERKFLLKKLFQYLPMTENQALQSTAALKSLAANFHGNLPPTVLGPVHPSSSMTGHASKKKHASKHGGSSKKKKELKSKQANGTEKPKRKKPGTAMKRKVQSIPVGEDGSPKFPVVLGGLTVHDLGEIAYDRPGFHSERYIWPVGYCSSRLYPSMITPENRVLYTCKILDGGSEPVFEITPEDCKDQPITASTATACHCAVLRRLNKARGKETTNTGSGPEFFGYSHPTVQYLIQSIADVTRLEKYKWVKFELPSKGPVPFMSTPDTFDLAANANTDSEGPFSESED